MLARVQKLSTRLARVLAMLAGIAILGLMLLSVIDIVGRTLAGGGLAGSIGFTEIGLVVVVYFGMSYAEVTKSHVRTPILTSRLPPRIANVSRLVGLVFVIAFVGASTYYSAVRALESIDSGEFRMGLIPMPVWPARAAIPIGLAALGLMYISRMIDIVIRLRRGPGPTQPGEAEPRFHPEGGL